MRRGAVGAAPHYLARQLPPPGLLPQLEEDPGELGLVGLGQDIGRGRPPLPRLHAHVERRAAPVGEPPVLGVELMRAHPQVQERTLQSTVPHLDILHRAVEAGLQEANPVLVGLQEAAGVGERLRVAVHRQEAAAGAALEEEASVPTPTHRPVQVEAAGAQLEEVQDLPAQDRLVVAGLGAIVHGASIRRQLIPSSQHQAVLEAGQRFPVRLRNHLDGRPEPLRTPQLDPVDVAVQHDRTGEAGRLLERGRHQNPSLLVGGHFGRAREQAPHRVGRGPIGPAHLPQAVEELPPDGLREQGQMRFVPPVHEHERFPLRLAAEGGGKGHPPLLVQLVLEGTEISRHVAPSGLGWGKVVNAGARYACRGANVKKHFADFCRMGRSS